MLDIKQEVFFSSRWYLCAQKSPHALHLASQKLPQHGLWNSSDVRLIYCGPFPSKRYWHWPTFREVGEGKVHLCKHHTITNKGGLCPTRRYRHQMVFMPNTLLLPVRENVGGGTEVWAAILVVSAPNAQSPECEQSPDAGFLRALQHLDADVSGSCWTHPFCWACTAGACNDWPGVAECGACSDWPGVVVCVMTVPGWWCVQWLAQCGGMYNDWPGVVVRAVTDLVCVMTGLMWWCMQWLAWCGGVCN